MTNLPIKYVLFDVANTLLHKPLLWEQIDAVLRNEGHVIPLQRLQYVHKITSETLVFPDTTSEAFYTTFNTYFLNNLGIVAERPLLETLFQKCKNLPWESFADVSILRDIRVKTGILSNFNSGLRSLLEETIPNATFSDLFISEEMDVRKPDLTFYQQAVARLNIPAAHILYVGDSVRLDLAPALEVGMQVKLIDRSEFFVPTAYRITSLKELLTDFDV